MKSAIIQAITGIWPQLKALGIEHIDIFGSEARGDAHGDSDVDVLVHMAQPKLHALVAARELLQLAIGRRVDVLTPGALEQRPRLKERVLREAMRVA